MKELAVELVAELERAAAQLRTLSEADVSSSRGPGKWVKKEILGHLIDSATNNHQRFVRAPSAQMFTWPDYEGESWVSLHRYRSRAWAELLELWVALNRHVAVVMESVPAGKRETACVIGEKQAVSLEFLMRDYLRHLRHHLAQLEGT
jgi:hypothetical protein